MHSAAAASTAPQSGPRKRRENAMSPTPMWMTLRSSSPRVSAICTSSPPLLLRRSNAPLSFSQATVSRQPLLQRARGVAELGGGAVRAVGPVVLVDLDQIGGELRRAAAHLRPGFLQRAGALGDPVRHAQAWDLRAGEPADKVRRSAPA